MMFSFVSSPLEVLGRQTCGWCGSWPSTCRFVHPVEARHIQPKGGWPLDWDRKNGHAKLTTNLGGPATATAATATATPMLAPRPISHRADTHSKFGRGAWLPVAAGPMAIEERTLLRSGGGDQPDSGGGAGAAARAAVPVGVELRDELAQDVLLRR